MVVIFVFLMIGGFIAGKAEELKGLAFGFLALGLALPFCFSIGGYTEETNTYSLSVISTETDNNSKSNTSKYLTSTGDSYTVKCTSSTGGCEFKEVPKNAKVNIIEREGCTSPTMTVSKKTPVGRGLLTFVKSSTSYNIIIPA